MNSWNYLLTVGLALREEDKERQREKSTIYLYMNEFGALMESTSVYYKRITSRQEQVLTSGELRATSSSSSSVLVSSYEALLAL